MIAGRQAEKIFFDGLGERFDVGCQQLKSLMDVLLQPDDLAFEFQAPFRAFHDLKTLEFKQRVCRRDARCD